MEDKNYKIKKYKGMTAKEKLLSMLHEAIDIIEKEIPDSAGMINVTRFQDFDCVNNIIGGKYCGDTYDTIDICDIWIEPELYDRNFNDKMNIDYKDSGKYREKVMKHAEEDKVFFHVNLNF